MDGGGLISKSFETPVSLSRLWFVLPLSSPYRRQLRSGCCNKVTARSIDIEARSGDGGAGSEAPGSCEAGAGFLWAIMAEPPPPRGAWKSSVVVPARAHSLAPLVGRRLLRLLVVIVNRLAIALDGAAVALAGGRGTAWWPRLRRRQGHCAAAAIGVRRRGPGGAEGGAWAVLCTAAGRYRGWRRCEQRCGTTATGGGKRRPATLRTARPRAAAGAGRPWRRG